MNVSRHACYQSGDLHLPLISLLKYLPSISPGLRGEFFSGIQVCASSLLFTNPLPCIHSHPGRMLGSMVVPESDSDRQRRPPGLARQGMAISLVEGLLVAGMFSFLEQWLVPLLQNRLGNDDPDIARHIALALTTIPVLGSVVMGLAMDRVIRFLGGSRRAVIIAAWVQIAALLLLTLPLLFPGSPWSLPLALALGCCINLVGYFSQPGWFTWMSELVPARMQGRYFGLRNRAFHFARIVFILIYAGIIHYFPVGTDAAGGIGLLLVVLCAAIFRIASTLTLMRQPVPPSLDANRGKVGEVTPTTGTSIAGLCSFLRSMPHTAFGRWTLMWSAMMFGVWITGPFIATYLTRSVERGGLGLVERPLLFAAILQVGSLVRLVTFPIMGRLVDRFGAIAVLRVALVGVSTVTVGWALITDPRLLVLNEVFAALCWCGAETAVQVLLMSCHSEAAERPRLMGYYQMASGLAVVLASLVGTAILELLPPLDGSVFRSLFVVGLCVRIPVALIALKVLGHLAACRPSPPAADRA